MQTGKSGNDGKLVSQVLELSAATTGQPSNPLLFHVADTRFYISDPPPGLAHTTTTTTITTTHTCI
jgi:hypothetical protein